MYLCILYLYLHCICVLFTLNINVFVYNVPWLEMYLCIVYLYGTKVEKQKLNEQANTLFYNLRKSKFEVSQSEAVKQWRPPQAFRDPVSNFRHSTQECQGQGQGLFWLKVKVKVKTVNSNR